ncbi:polyhydroxyalkanoate synthesis repressor PhaR [Temperatibacter marinus]|uniref:Polyhydroxyalkanoate synthesis repressor PhaR n=1 Tax=Temperatibacter marinus TaxID=1456591 RepID=A0AA52EF64_9PROT|nr:polyhydroxyalkanoate synthesis repressor PhaR [Temperatibacter marinus]WND01407.1 polyhydroxyalkanoate synthesis repressor PhaR [Temperatibacter marinus]
MARKKTETDGPIIIKKYANRRLYNTDTSSYVTLDHLAELVKEDRDFVVVDAKSGDEITRSVLAQIIFDKESKDSGSENMLPVSFLKQLISLYGEGMQQFVPNYLQASLETFMANQQKIQEQFSQPEPMKMFEEMTKQNMAMMQEGMKFFAGNMNKQPQKAAAPEEESKPQEKAEHDPQSEQISALQSQLAALQDQISKLGQ